MTDDRDISTTAHFLDPAEVTEAAQAEFDADLAELGFVMNAVRLWAYQPETYRRLLGLMSQVASVAPFSFRQRGILVLASVSALGDSYCSLAWGTKLAGRFGAEVPGGILRGEDETLSKPERVMAAWARQVTRNPNGTTASDVGALREAGFRRGHLRHDRLHRVAPGTGHCERRPGGVPGRRVPDQSASSSTGLHHLRPADRRSRPCCAALSLNGRRA